MVFLLHKFLDSVKKALSEGFFVYFVYKSFSITKLVSRWPRRSTCCSFSIR